MIDRRKTDLVRPCWDFDDYYRKVWRDADVTAIMCERDTADILKLTLESLLKFYPDLPLLVIDGGSTDDSVTYMLEKIIQYPNIKLWQRDGRNGHGTMLDEGIRKFITTKYVLLLDSDIIIRRGGWLEEMLQRMNAEDIYAIGTLMQVSFSGDGCSEPKDDSDILRYTHPSCALICREQYLTMRPFIEHGAPLYANMQDAQTNGLRVEYFPIEQYLAHLSGASWCDPRTIWKNDMGVHIRPFFTFIVDTTSDIPGLLMQKDSIFDIVPIVSTHAERVVIHFIGYFDVNNSVYNLRHKVTGEYICYMRDAKIKDEYFVGQCRGLLINNGLPDRFTSNGFEFIKRQVWQMTDALL